MGSIACIFVYLDVQHVHSLIYMHRYAEISIGPVLYSLWSSL